MYSNCVEVVEARKKAVPNLDTTKILNELLANDKWLEQVNIYSECLSSYSLLFNSPTIEILKHHPIFSSFLLCSNLNECRIYGQMLIHSSDELTNSSKIFSPHSSQEYFMAIVKQNEREILSSFQQIK